MQISVLVQPNVKNVGSKSRRHPEGNPNASVKNFRQNRRGYCFITANNESFFSCS